MILTAFATAFFTSILILAGLFYFLHLVRTRIYSTVRNFVTAPDDKTLSQLAVMGDQLAYLFAQRLTLQLKATFMGLASGEARAEKAEALANNPGLVNVLSLIPGARKLFKNPELINLAGAALSKFANRRNGGNHEAESTVVENPFKL